MNIRVFVFGLLVVCAAAARYGPEPATNPDPPEIWCKHFILGYPTGTPASNDLIIRDAYALSSNDTTKFADWVAYRLTPHEVLGTLDLKRVYREDPWLSDDETLEPDDYDDFNASVSYAEKYDHGHQAPLGSFKGSRFASQTNYLSNITPQRSSLNQGRWRTLETEIRGLVGDKYDNEIWVMTGPLYETSMRALPNPESHTVPSGYWKIVVARENSDLKVAAFIYDQDTSSGSVTDHLVTLGTVEQRSGLTFLRELPAAEKTAILNDMTGPAAWVANW